jgi:hypothetical protein
MTETLEQIEMIVMEEDAPLPAVKFRPYKYKHKLEAIELTRKMDAGESTEEDDLKFLMRMIVDWDLKDEETGQPIPVGEFMELSIVQVEQVKGAWRKHMAALNDEVKKTRERL